jgi:hypothetical protein
MRLCEFATHEDFLLTEDVLVEEHLLLLEYLLNEEEQQSRFKFLSMAAAKLKGAADKAVTMVTNTADAMRLLYQIVKDPVVMLKSITLLRQALSQLLANAHATIKGFLNKILPKTNNLVDFFKTLLIYAGVAGLAQLSPQAMTMDFAGGIAKQALAKFTSLDSLVSNLIASGGASIMPVIDGLKLAHDLFFDVLSRIAKLLGSVIKTKSGGVFNLAKVVEARGRKPGGWYLINSQHQPIEAVNSDNYDDMTAFYANPHPGQGYIGFIDRIGEVTHHLTTNQARQVVTVSGKPW